MILRISLAFIAVAFAIPTAGQDGVVQVQFSAQEIGQGVYLGWTMEAGQTCNGIDIQRSTDGVNFTTVGSIFGFCGSSDERISYSFLDESPVDNAINHYRLQLGNLGPSKIVSVEIIRLSGQGVQIRPNPISDEGRIYFANEKREAFELNLYDISGGLIRQFRTNADFFTISRENLNQGMYFISIAKENSDERLSGKVLVIDR